MEAAPKGSNYEARQDERIKAGCSNMGNKRAKAR